MPLNLLGKGKQCWSAVMIGVCPGFRNATVSLTLSITCFTVATQQAWSRRRGSNDVMVTSKPWLLLLDAWWADHVMLVELSTSSVRLTFSSQSYSGAKFLLNTEGSGNGWLATGRGSGCFLLKKAGRMFENDSGIPGTVFALLSESWSGGLFSLDYPRLDVGTWKCLYHEMMYLL